MTSDAPIGLLDSGFGGLSVARAIRKTLPHEHLIFAADCGFAPWGDRTDAFIRKRCDALVEFLCRQGIKALVLACNTATAVCASELRSRLNIPVVGIEPAIFPAVRATQTGVIGVLATTKTVSSEKYAKLSHEALRWAQTERGINVRLISIGAPGLMECVERGDFNGIKTQQLIERLTAPMREANADQIVLGCTHYPFLSEAITRAVPHATLLDPAPAVAQQLRRRLAEKDLLSLKSVSGQTLFFATDANTARRAVLAKLWPGLPELKEIEAD